MKNICICLYPFDEMVQEKSPICLNCIRDAQIHVGRIWCQEYETYDHRDCSSCQFFTIKEITYFIYLPLLYTVHTYLNPKIH